MKKILLSLALACFGLAVNSNAQTIMSQNFSTAPTLPTGWSMTTSGPGAGWTATSSNTNLYFGTVPAVAPDADYVVVNDYSVTTPGNDPAVLTSATFSLATATSPYLGFDYVFYGAYIPGAATGDPDTTETAWVEISTDGGSTWAFVDTIPALSSGSSWTTEYMNLATWVGSPSCMLRFYYTDNGAAVLGCAIGNVDVFNAQANDISLTAISPLSGDPGYDFVATGSAATFSGIARNLSPSTITSFTASYSVSGSTPVTTTFSGLTLAPMATYTFTCTPYTDPTAGSQPVQMWVTETGDPVLTNDSMTTAINAYVTLPNKVVAYEEGTGMWCGYCVRGIIFMDSLEKNDSANVNIAAVHDQLNGTDDLAAENTLTSDYDKFVSNFPGFTGYPGVLVDRRYVIDPSEALSAQGQLSSYFGFANVTAGFTIESGQVKASATVTPGIPMSGDYRLALVVTEDQVHNASYYQHNYYSEDFSSPQGPMYGVGFNFQDSVFSIPGSSMYFRFVARYTVPDMYTTSGGVAGSLPATMAAGTAYSYNFTPVTIASDWNPLHLRVIAFLIDNNTNTNTSMQILNSSGHASPAGVSSTNSGVEKFTVFPNPSKDQAHAYFTLNTTDMVGFAIYDAVGRQVFVVPAETMQQGDQQINFSTANLPSGIYNVSVTTSTGTETQKLSVIR